MHLDVFRILQTPRLREAEVFIPLPMQIVGEANVQVPWNWDTVCSSGDVG